MREEVLDKRLERIRLVERVRMALDDLREAAWRNDQSLEARAATALAKLRFAALNRTLALAMLDRVGT